MPRSSSKRGREEAGDAEDIGTYSGHPQTGAPAVKDPLPQRDPPGTIATDTPHSSPPQMREEARIAFLTHPMLPEPENLEQNHNSALLALLIEREWGETVIRLIAKVVPKKKASAIWNA